MIELQKKGTADRQVRFKARKALKSTKAFQDADDYMKVEMIKQKDAEIYDKRTEAGVHGNVLLCSIQKKEATIHLLWNL